MRRFDILDAWRTLAIVLMAAYHFLYDLYIFGIISADRLFSTPLNILERFICCSFILTVLAAGLAVEIGAAVAGQTIRWGVLMLLGASMVLWHLLGKYLQKLPGAALGWGSLALFFLSRAWTAPAMVTVGWLYPLGFTAPGFYSADYFPLLPWFFLFLLGTVLGGWCLENRDSPLLTKPLPKALTWPGRHSLILYVLHQPVLYGISYLLWGT